MSRVDVVLFTIILVSSCNFGISTIIQSSSASCSLDDSDTYRELERCLETGDTYIRKYLKHVTRGKAPDKQCSKFENFKICMESLMERCPNMREDIPEPWIKVYDVIKCSCDGDEHCVSLVRCFSREQSSLMTSRCDDLYRFNRRQHTRHRCHHIHENIRCKEALVTSSCGNETGDFAFHMLELNNRDTMRDFRCKNMSRELEYNGFQYSPCCPSNFTQQMAECGSVLSEEHRLTFYDDNDLIAKRKKAINVACRRYSDYSSCVAPLRSSCPHGSQLVYDYLGELRTYILKMNFICSEEMSYRQHLSCYKSVLENDTLSSCDQYYKQLAPRLKRVTAYEFYCQIGHKDTRQIRSSLGQLVGCYEEVFAKQCGSDGGQTIGALMSEAFMDPYYLKYDHKPDCEYHSQHDVIHGDVINADVINAAVIHTEVMHTASSEHSVTSHPSTSQQRPSPRVTKPPYPDRGSSQTLSRASNAQASQSHAVKFIMPWKYLILVLTLIWEFR